MDLVLKIDVDSWPHTAYTHTHRYIRVVHIKAPVVVVPERAEGQPISVQGFKLDGVRVARRH